MVITMKNRLMGRVKNMDQLPSDNTRARLKLNSARGPNTYPKEIGMIGKPNLPMKNETNPKTKNTPTSNNELLTE